MALNREPAVQIERVWLFVAVDPDGRESIVAFRGGPSDTWMPMVCSDAARVESLMPIARRIARDTGRDIKVVEFSARMEKELIRGPE